MAYIELIIQYLNPPCLGLDIELNSSNYIGKGLIWRFEEIVSRNLVKIINA